MRAAFFVGLAELLGLVAPYLTKLVVDRVIIEQRADLLWPLVGAGLVLYLLGALARYAGRWQAYRTGERLWYRLRNEAFEHLQHLSLAYHASSDPGERVNQAHYDTRALRDVVTAFLPAAVQLLVGVTATGVLLLVLAPRLTALAFIALPMLVLTAWLYQGKVRPLSRRSSEAQANVAIELLQALSNVEALKVFAAEPWFRERVDRSGRELREIELEYHRHQARLVPGVNFSVALVLMLVLGFGGQMALAGTLSVGTLVAFVFYVSRSLGPVRRIPSLVFGLHRASASADRLDEVFDSRDALSRPDSPRSIPDGPVELHVDDVVVEFRNSHSPNGDSPNGDSPDGDDSGERHRALDGISFQLPAGGRVALLGPSGAGKTTTSRLVPRLMDPTAGRVTAAGVPLDQLDLGAWRRRIGFVGQEVSLLRGSIRENITFGYEGPIGQGRLARAVQLAALDEVVDARPEGLDAPVGEAGAKLSGGQRKRVALARALLREPDILVVDQLAADLERDLCERIFRGIGEQMDVSILYVGHRLPQGFEPDETYFIERGRLEPMSPVGCP